MGRSGHALLACVVLASAGLTVCQALYGGKPEKLRNPEKKKKPPEPPDEVATIKYVDDCAADFRGDPAKVSPQPSIANQPLGGGETALQSSDRAKDRASAAELIKLSIDKFRNA